MQARHASTKPPAGTLKEDAMRFLLHIRTQLPGGWTPEQRGDILQRETAAAVTLRQQGVLRRIFRIVGQQASFSLWEADTLEELHAVLASLPLYRFMVTTVTPIIRHPVEEKYEQAYGSIPPLRGW
jgi:muconolactone D-isomerase